MSPATIHPAQFDDERLLDDCKVTRTRRSGPGGQHRNKVESAIVIEHVPSGIIAEANERRSQHENRKVALERLRVNLAIGLRCDPNVEDSFQLWYGRCKSGKIQINPEHRDFPILLAKALDVFFANDFDLKKTAEQLQVSSSQLVKFFKLEPRAFRLVNAKRVEHGLHAFK